MKISLEYLENELPKRRDRGLPERIIHILPDALDSGIPEGVVRNYLLDSYLIRAQQRRVLGGVGVLLAEEDEHKALLLDVSEEHPKSLSKQVARIEPESWRWAHMGIKPRIHR